LEHFYFLRLLNISSMLRLALLFLVLIVYGSLYPFAVWVVPSGRPFGFLLSWPMYLSRPDLVQNVLAYAPFGLFLSAWLLQRRSLTGRGALARVAGAALLLSLSMECLQQFEPARNASTADIAMNVLGSLIGAMLALLLDGDGLPATVVTDHVTALPWFSRHRLHAARARSFHCGILPNLGFAAIALWALAETSPLVPAFDLADLGSKIGFLTWQLAHPLTLSLPRLIVAAAQLSSLGLLMRLLVRDDGAGRLKHAVPLFAAVLAAVFIVKMLVYGRHLMIEELLAAALALAAVHGCRNGAAPALAAGGAALLLGGFVADELLPGPGMITWQFNWVPLSGQMRSLSGLENILVLFWPFFTLAVFGRFLTPARRREPVSWLGGLLVLALVFQLEWMQQALPGRYGDFTQVLLALGGWLLPWSFRTADFKRPLPVPAAASTAAPTAATSTA
jgi:VanZ family protein